MTSPFRPEDSALLLIDHQIGTMQLIHTMALEDGKRFTLALAKAARILGMPVVLTASQEDRIQGPLLPELETILPDAFAARVKRGGVVNAWADPDFKAAVAATGRRNFVMAGVTTDVCLVFPAIDAVAEGYRVQAVMDASGSPYALSEEVARQHMAAAGVTLTATNTIIAELAQDWSTPEGQKLIQLLCTDVIPPVAA